MIADYGVSGPIGLLLLILIILAIIYFLRRA